MGRALTTQLRLAGFDVPAIGGRGATGDTYDAVLLAVPDGAIAAAAAHITPGRLVGHLSGATSLAALADHEAFSLHPLMTVPADPKAEISFTGVWAAVAGTTDRAIEFAETLARSLGMRPFLVADEDRTAYHAAASIASNYLITLEGIAEELAATAGVPREALLPLVHASVNNWATLGAAAALTGPIARGDEATVAAQRAAIEDRTPEHTAVFDVLVDATRALAATQRSTETS